VIKLIVFIAGPRAIKKLNNNIEERLYNIYLNNIKVVVGDAAGVDKAVQDYFCRLNYSNVNVYATQGKARNNVGNWPVVDVEVDKTIKGFDYYAAKDVKMAEVADYGFMIWNGKSKGTLNNIINLASRNKKTLIYFTPDSEFYCIDSINQLEKILLRCDNAIRSLYNSLLNKTEQLSIMEENDAYVKTGRNNWNT
jgi:hypothetical protein